MQALNLKQLEVFCTVVEQGVARPMWNRDAVALRLNMPAFMLKLVSSVIVIIAIAGPYLKSRYPELHRRLAHAREKGGEGRA